VKVKKINFSILCHFKGTIGYYKTKDVFHVMTALGHKKINNTFLMKPYGLIQNLERTL